jgi:plastocyanin
MAREKTSIARRYGIFFLPALLLSAAGVLAHTNSGGSTGQSGTSPSTGQQPGTSASVTPLPTTESQNTGDERQVYTTQLQSANSSLGFAFGTARVVVDGGRIGVLIDGGGFAPDVVHPAHIHRGTQCATLSADANGDGFVDVVEATPVIGDILLSLDGDPSSADPDILTFPRADSQGNLDYIGSSKVDSPIDLSEAIIEIHGVGEDVTLPSTVQTVSGLTPTQSIPVACGKLVQISGPAAGQTGASPTPTSSPEVSPSPTTTATPTETPTASPTESPSPLVTPTETPTPLSTPTGSPSPQASPGTTPSAPPAATQVNVAIPANSTGLGPQAYGTNPLVVSAGTTVTWTNNDSVPHSATSDSGIWDSGVLQPGESFSFTFDQPGTYSYFCTVHGQQSMSGVITVS